MDTLECIESRRSVREYTDAQIPKETVEQLIHLGIRAATGSNMQPWGFVVIQNSDEINSLSETTKTYLRENLEHFPDLQQYASLLSKPEFHVFNNAPTVVVIYGNKSSTWRHNDGSMAAAHIMLGAHDRGLGSCWIGFAHATLNTPKFKAKHHVPENFELVAVLALGYPRQQQAASGRRNPVIFSWT